MNGFPTPFGGGGGNDRSFDEEGEFVPEHIPTPGIFLEGQDVLTGEEHVAFHRITRELFEERGVYDITFGYNLARLNLDTRHPDAGYRYAEEADNPAVLRAEFTPTTPFCPQSDTLSKGSIRAWNGLRERHEYDFVRVRVAEMHNQSEEINRALEQMEQKLRETGVDTHQAAETSEAAGDAGSGCGDGFRATSRGDGTDAPF